MVDTQGIVNDSIGNLVEEEREQSTLNLEWMTFGPLAFSEERVQVMWIQPSFAAPVVALVLQASIPWPRLQLREGPVLALGTLLTFP